MLGDNMKKKIILSIISIFAGAFFTYFILNKDYFYAKEKYNLYVFQTGAFSDYENAKKYAKTMPSSMIYYDNFLYRVYIAIYKDIDLMNKMLVYFENNNIHIYIKNIEVSKDLYNNIDSYENILKNTDENKVFNKVNQSILNLYNEEIINEKINKK
jgi:hypothetical protein